MASVPSGPAGWGAYVLHACHDGRYLHHHQHGDGTSVSVP